MGVDGKGRHGGRNRFEDPEVGVRQGQGLEIEVAERSPQITGRCDERGAVVREHYPVVRVPKQSRVL